eukprot:CAMPEP_0198305838 /NCGR_PEP_ID=MMETSP1449-20131203/58112_1 /TAXON_ID=420275 /ORGANISM="Attheya septentrionalis, Strain CCMP2084" /LENGTH=369 /DNA_ID=CAMNT_0044008379 /DNA_START=512 /DNA_END=1618 /DNA_ORIENTATION=-
MENEEYDDEEDDDNSAPSLMGAMSRAFMESNVHHQGSVEEHVASIGGTETAYGTSTSSTVVSDASPLPQLKPRWDVEDEGIQQMGPASDVGLEYDCQDDGTDVDSISLEAPEWARSNNSKATESDAYLAEIIKQQQIQDETSCAPSETTTDDDPLVSASQFEQQQLSASRGNNEKQDDMIHSEDADDILSEVSSSITRVFAEIEKEEAKMPPPNDLTPTRRTRKKTQPTPYPFFWRSHPNVPRSNAKTKTKSMKASRNNFLCVEDDPEDMTQSSSLIALSPEISTEEENEIQPSVMRKALQMSSELHTKSKSSSEASTNASPLAGLATIVSSTSDAKESFDSEIEPDPLKITTQSVASGMELTNNESES